MFFIGIYPRKHIVIEDIIIEKWDGMGGEEGGQSEIGI